MTFLTILVFSSILTLVQWLVPSIGATDIPISLAFLPSSLSGLALIQPTIPAAIPGLQGVFAGTPPTLGVQDDRLAPCPTSPNCVVSQGDETDASHKIEPIAYGGDRATIHNALVNILVEMPRTNIVTETDDYIRVEATSRLMGFVDDAEFFFPNDQAVIHVRSASRVGESDLGVNRNRIEQIRAAILMTHPAAPSASEALPESGDRP